MTKAKIGFIGLGLMGGAMVGRLQDKGYSLTVLGNRNRTYLDAAIARGAVEAANAKAVAEAADVIMLCMDTSASVEGRMRGPDGVLAGLSAGKTVIDFGTSLPGSTQVLAEEAAEKGAHYLDAPLGRTPAHAKDGLLNIMGAGDAEAFEAVRPILEDLGENIFHLGASGAGHTLKLFNNFIAMTTASALSEAFAMADRAGLDRQSLFDVMGAGPLRSGMMEFIRNYAVEGKIDLAFSVSNAAKDIGYYTQMAEGLGAPSIMGQCAKSALEMAKTNGHGEKMVPEMIDILADHFSKNA